MVTKLEKEAIILSTQNPNPWSREAWQQTGIPCSPQGTYSQNGAAQPSNTIPTQTEGQPESAQSAPRAQQSASYQYIGGPQQHAAGYAPQAPQNPLVMTKPQATKSHSRLAGIVTLAVLAGAVGGGGAGYGVATYLGSNQGAGATTTQVVQADTSHPDWATVAEAVSNAVASISVTAADGSEGLGSGVVIDSAGHVVTNNHVVSGVGSQATITVVLDNVAYNATVVGTDPATDLAVLQLVNPPADLKVMTLADSSSLAVGDEVMAIGNPLGLSDTVTTGIVSALNRPVTTEAVTENKSPVSRSTGSSDLVVTAAIQTSAAINPGNSGGALINSSGELIGITSSIATLSSGQSSGESGSIGLGFAIPVNQVKYVADQLIATGTAEHPQIGISAQDASGAGQLGARVSNVTSGSPAASAGIQPGDLITAVDGASVSSTESLVALVRASQVGQSITLTVERNGQSSDVDVTTVAASK